MVSVEGTDATFHFEYDHPRGIIIYDPSGWMSVQIDIKGIRKPFVKGPAAGTDEEKVAAFDNYVAYYGTYTLDLKAQTITHHLEDASHQIGAVSTMSAGSSFKAMITLFPARTEREE